MRITQLSCDWKSSIQPSETIDAAKSVGGEMLAYDYDQQNVDSKVVFISSEVLTTEQLDILWTAGDLFMGDQVWEGTFDEIIAQIEKYADKLADSD